MITYSGPSCTWKDAAEGCGFLSDNEILDFILAKPPRPPKALLIYKYKQAVVKTCELSLFLKVPVFMNGGNIFIGISILLYFPHSRIMNEACDNVYVT